jgi:hypothetical protein
VAVSRFVLNVSGVDGDTTLFFFGSVVNLIERLNLFRTEAFLMENLRNGSGQGGLTVVYVTNSTNVNMRLGAHKCFFSHSFAFYLLIDLSNGFPMQKRTVIEL